MTDPAVGDADEDLPFARVLDLDVVDERERSGVLLEECCAHVGKEASKMYQS